MPVDLISILNQGAFSMNTQRGLAALASHNIENANTPGYSRQSAVLEAIQPGDFVNGAFIGGGASIQSVSQARNQFLENQIPAAMGQSARSLAESTILGSITALDPEDPGNVGTGLASFYGSLRALSQNPGDMGLRESVLGQANALALDFNRTYQSLEGTRSGVDTQLSTLVAKVNDLAQQLASLNTQIQKVKVNAQPNDLMDQRQNVIDQLEELTGGTPIPDAVGNISFALANGATLVSQVKAGSLSVSADVNNNGHLKIQMTGVDGNGPNDIGGTVGGTLGGLITARDGAILTAENRLDSLAFEFAGAINAQHELGYDLHGNNDPTSDLFDMQGLATAPGAASKIRVNANIMADPSLLQLSANTSGIPGVGLPGDNGALLKMIGTETQLLTTSGVSATDTMASITSQFGASTSSAQAISQHDASWTKNLTTMRESYSGVSIDEELMNLQKAQAGYEAISKVITTTQSMLDVLMQLK